MQVPRTQDPTVRYLPLLVTGDADGLASLFEREPLLDDPGEGRVEGHGTLLRFVQSSHKWLVEKQAQAEHFALTVSGERSVAEQVLHLTIDGKRIGLPVALVGERGAGGKLRELRIYHSMWPLTGGHKVRSPLLQAAHNLELPQVVERYQWALGTAELDTILSVFEPDGYAQEPSGGEYVHRGPEGRRELYSALFSDGGIPLEHCSVTFDGTRCAIEYNVVRWGEHRLKPQAGVAVYEIGPSGLLAAARIYDDVAVEEGAQG